MREAAAAGLSLSQYMADLLMLRKSIGRQPTAVVKARKHGTGYRMAIPKEVAITLGVEHGRYFAFYQTGHGEMAIFRPL
jgi:hypothetical protein